MNMDLLRKRSKPKICMQTDDAIQKMSGFALLRDDNFNMNFVKTMADFKIKELHLTEKADK